MHFYSYYECDKWLPLPANPHDKNKMNEIDTILALTRAKLLSDRKTSNDNLRACYFVSTMQTLSEACFIAMRAQLDQNEKQLREFEEVATIIREEFDNMLRFHDEWLEQDFRKRFGCENEKDK